jgi:hypothetical protein
MSRRNVTAIRGDARRVGGGCGVASEPGGCQGRVGVLAGIDFIRACREVVKRREVRRENRASFQGELDDAAQDENQQSGGNGQIQRIAHSSPCTSVSVLLS